MNPIIGKDPFSKRTYPVEISAELVGDCSLEFVDGGGQGTASFASFAFCE